MQYNRDVSLIHGFLIIAYFFFATLEVLYAIIGVNADFNMALLFLNTCIFLPLIIRSRKSNNNFVLDPYYIYGLWYSLCYLISTTPVYLSTDFSGYFVTVNLDPINPNHVGTIIMLGIGILSFYLGYSIKVYKSKTICNIQITPRVETFLKKYHRLFGYIYIYSVLFRIYGFSIGAMGSLSSTMDAQWPPIPFISVFVFIANVWPLYLAGVMLYALDNNNKRIIVLLLLLELFFVIVSGDRRNVIFVLFIFLFCYRIVNSQLPWSAIKLAIPAVLLLLPFLTIIGYTMKYMDKIDLSSISTILSISADRLSSLSMNDVLKDFIYSPIIDSFGYISNVFVANIEFALKGETWGSVGLENVFSKFVPGFIGGGSFDERYYYQLFAERFLTYKVDYSHLTFTFQSEMVLSYGLLSIPIGMFIQGMFASFLFRIAISDTCHPLFFIFYCGFCYKFSLGLISGLLTPDFIVGIRALFYLSIILLFIRTFGTHKQLSYTK